MPADDEFQELIRRVRAGDADAARAVVERYEGMVRRVVRFRLTDPRLRAVVDSMDVCQSVLGSFFVRAAHGEYDLDGADQLTRLLAEMARNKLAAQARRHAAGKRDYRRAQAGEVDQDGLVGGDPSPSHYAETTDLLRAVRERLTPQERELADLRQQGLGWAEIAARVGENEDAVRKRFSRAMDRVASELGLDEPGA